MSLRAASEGKRRWPSEETISKIAAVLDVEVYRLFISNKNEPIKLEKTPKIQKIHSQITEKIVKEVRRSLKKT